MPDTARELVAFAIIGVIVLGAAGAYFATRPRRRREALRRQGVKSYNK